MSPLDLLRTRFVTEGGLCPSDVADLLNIATAGEFARRRADAQLSESRLQVAALLAERERARDVVAEAQHIVMSSLPGLLTRLGDAQQDVYISVLHNAGAEITYQPADAEYRTQERTFAGESITEAVELCRAHLLEST